MSATIDSGWLAFLVLPIIVTVVATIDSGWLALVLPIIVTVVLLKLAISLLTTSHQHRYLAEFSPNRLNGSYVTQSATELAKRLKSGDCTSLQLVNEFISHIESVNPRLNAMVANRFEVAREEARAADMILRSSKRSELYQRRPFHGVPCSVKECISVAGMPQTSGLIARKDFRASEDATVVARLRQAGFIVLGVTNTSELCLWWESHNRLYGITRNAYNGDCIVGGSSGGEAALISACGAPCGVGSDIGGSIRMPAFFNGVYGHKPTAGTIPGTGQYPIAEGKGMRLLTTGPICRHAEDLWPLFELMRGPDGKDLEVEHRQYPRPTPAMLPGMRVVSVVQPNFPFFVSRVGSELREAQAAALAFLSDAGAHTEDAFHLDGMRHMPKVWLNAMSLYRETGMKQLMGLHTNTRAWLEVLRWTLGSSNHTAAALILAVTEDFPGLMPQRRLYYAEEVKEELLREVEEAIGSNGGMLFPSMPRPAPKHHHPLLSIFDFVYNAVFNVLELPSTQVCLLLPLA